VAAEYFWTDAAEKWLEETSYKRDHKQDQKS
jgi:hypothetical protein